MEEVSPKCDPPVDSRADPAGPRQIHQRDQRHKQWQPHTQPAKRVKPSREASAQFEEHHLAVTPLRGEIRMQIGQCGVRMEISELDLPEEIQDLKSFDALQTKPASPIIQ